MDVGPASAGSRPDLPEPRPSRLLADPLFHLESQRQVSLRHLRRLKRLQAAGESDADFIGAEEHAKDVHLAKIRLKADLKILGTMVDELRSASAERRKGWRWSMPVLYVSGRIDRLKLGTSAKLEQCFCDSHARAFDDSPASLAEEWGHCSGSCVIGSTGGEKILCADDIRATSPEGHVVERYNYFTGKCHQEDNRPGHRH